MKKEKFVRNDGTEVEIEFQICGGLIDDMGDGHEFLYEAEGEDEEGIKYYGIAVVIDGVWEETDEIEESY